MFTDLLAAGARLHPHYTSHYYSSYGYGSGFHLGSGVLGWLVLIVIIYVVIHLIIAHLLHGLRRLTGNRMDYGRSLARGPWVSWRIFGGNYYHNV